MNEGPDLEELLSNNSESQELSLKDKLIHHSKYFVVDGSASVLFYTPFMTATEYISGMESDEILTSRTIGGATAFMTGYAYSIFRQWWAKTFKTDAQSTELKKLVIDTTVAMASMIPFYAPMLYVAGASPKEMMYALLTGSAVGAASGRAYGYVLDRWRQFWGLEPALNRKL